MNTKSVISVIVSTLVTTLAIVGITYAATPASNDTSFLNKGTVEVDSIKVGKQGSGGVTFFNGSIVNITTDGGVDNPVTFADNVRIDGRVYRGESSGSGDSKPFIINDDAQVTGNLDVGGNDIVAELAGKANNSNVYIKNEIDNKLALKGDASVVASNTTGVSTNTTNITTNGAAITNKANNADVVKKADTVTRYFTVPSTAFVPEAKDIDVERQNDGSLRISGTTATSNRFYAPVEIPNGAIISEVLLVNKTGNTNAPTLQFYRTSIAGVLVQIGSTLSINSAPYNTMRTDILTGLTSESVDTQNNAYWLRYDLNSTIDNYLYSVRVKYAITKDK